MLIIVISVWWLSAPIEKELNQDKPIEINYLNPKTHDTSIYSLMTTSLSHQCCEVFKKSAECRLSEFSKPPTPRITKKVHSSNWHFRKMKCDLKF